MSLFDLPNEVIDRLDVLGLEGLRTYRFAVQIDGVDGKELVMGFQEVGGLDAKVGVRKIKEGGFNGTHVFPARAKENKLTLKRGMTFSRALYNWFQQVQRWSKGQPSYLRTLSIYLLHDINMPVAGEIVFEAWRWDVFKAWPSEWHGPALNANKSDQAIESVVIQHGGLVESQGMLSGTAGEILSVFQ